MTNDWLAPVRAALDAAEWSPTVFFRDDDAGWDDDRLMRLLDLFDTTRTPVDVAVIPDALTPTLAARLLRRAGESDGRVGLHQHGRTHANHEREGRACEFGPSRSREEQARDIAAGAARLAQLLGSVVQPIFTPPWNRCTADTAECLAATGAWVLSRIDSAPPLGVAGVRELPVSVDWQARRGGVRVERAAVVARLAAALRERSVVGIMLHHAAMDDADFAAVADLLALVASHPRVARRDMMAVATSRPAPPAAHPPRAVA
jgi:hypothetical protein